MALLSKGQFARAIPQLRCALELQPSSFKYSLALAEALLSSNYNFTALHFLLKLKPQFQDRAEYRYTLGLAYYLCYQYRNAIRQFRMFPQDDPQFNRIPFLIGNCYMAMGELSQAEVFFRRAINLNSSDAAYYVSLAKMLRMEGPQHLSEAMEALRQALSLDPKNAYARLHLAYCEEEEGSYRDALIVLRQLIADHPDFQPAWLALAAVYEHDGKSAMARKQREIAARLKPPAQFHDPELGPVASNLSSQ
jgi:tetratricopeptide (TPR) repeat protein